MKPTVVQNADKSVFIENHDGGTVKETLIYFYAFLPKG